MSCISRSWSEGTVDVGCKERVRVVEVPGRLWVDFSFRMAELTLQQTIHSALGLAHVP